MCWFYFIKECRRTVINWKDISDTFVSIFQVLHSFDWIVMAYSLCSTLLIWACKFHLHFLWQHASQMWEQLLVCFHKEYCDIHFIRWSEIIYIVYLTYHAAVTGYFYIFGSGLIADYFFKPYIEDIFLSSMYATLSLYKFIMQLTLWF